MTSKGLYKSEPPPKRKGNRDRHEKDSGIHEGKNAPLHLRAHPRYWRTRRRPAKCCSLRPGRLAGASLFAIYGERRDARAAWDSPGQAAEILPEDFLPTWMPCGTNQQQLVAVHGGPVSPLGSARAVYISDPARRHGHKRSDDAVERQPFGGQFGVARHSEFESGVGASVELFREQRNRRILVRVSPLARMRESVRFSDLHKGGRIDGNDSDGENIVRVTVEQVRHEKKTFAALS